MRIIVCLTLVAAILSAGVLAWVATASGADPYLSYVQHAPEFQRVRQDRQMLLDHWDTWIYMPWRYQWTIGTGDEGGQFCRDYGLNGGFTDHGSGPFEWLNKWNLRFYNDHTVARGSIVAMTIGWELHTTSARPGNTC